MPVVVGISGSLRRGSYNTMLLHAAARLMPDIVTFEIASIRDIPLYNADLETEEGFPSSVNDVKEKLISAGGLLIATPEYNHSIPGVVKNAIDWLSRPPKDIPRVFGGLPVALMGASTGNGGTALSQNAWLPILQTLRTRAWFGRSIGVRKAGEKFGEDGELRDEKTRELLETFVTEFAAYVLSCGRPGAPPPDRAG